jgi:capsular exopolysaccharide synthesis family protein
MNELETYHGHEIIREAVGQEPASESAGTSVVDLLSAIMRRWHIVFLVFVGMCAAGLPAIWFLIKPTYVVTGAVHVAPILANILTGEADKGEISNYQIFIKTQAEMMQSPQVLQRVADDLAPKKLSFFETHQDNFLATLKQRIDKTAAGADYTIILKLAMAEGRINIAPARQSELMKVTMNTGKPEEAKGIINAIIQAYMAVEVSNSAQGQDQILTALEDTRRVLLEKVQSQREAIRQLAEEYGTTSYLTGRQDMMLQRVTTLLGELTKLDAHSISLEAQKQLLERAPGQPFALEQLLKMRNEYVNSDPTVQELTRMVVQTDHNLILAEQDLAPQNPVLQQKRKLLETLRARLKEKRQQTADEFDKLLSKTTDKANEEKLAAVTAELKQLGVYEDHLRKLLDKEDAQTVEMGRKQLRIQDLQFQLNLDNEAYEKVRRRIRELEMERKRPARISVAYRAEIADIKDKRVKYSAALVFAALVCGMGIAHWRNLADKSVYTPADVVKHIDIRIIGTTTSANAVKRELLPRQVVEDYQTIRANLGLLGDNGMPKKLVVTSPGMREGKTTLAVNLATSLARSGKKVLLIDGDLRKPDVADMLNLPKGSRGLQDVLFGVGLDHAIHRVHPVELDVLAADSRNRNDACELLSSPLVAKKINAAARAYDHVIIDTPPVLAFPDALLWAKVADAAILTSCAGRTTASDLKDARDKLGEINVRVLGMVLGNVSASHGYYRYGYNYYYAQDGKRRKRGRHVNSRLLLPVDKEQADNDTSES